MFCLVSEQTIPNILPALQLKPDLVYLISTIDQAAKGVIIADFLRSKGINCEQKENFDPYDVISITEKLKELTDARPDDSFVLNVTGGTKLMALAAYSVFNKPGREIFYCNTLGNSIKYLYPFVEDIPLNSELNVPSFLAACGYKMSHDSKVVLTPEKTVFFKLVRNGSIKNIHRLFEVLRKSPANYESLLKETGFGHFEFKRNGKLFTLSSQKHFLELTATKKFFDGFWLEEYCYWYSKTILGLNPLSSVNISSKEGTMNEVDLMFVHNSRLYLVSCKSGDFDKKDLVEIESLKSLAGGTFGKAFMISLNPYSPAIITRAKQLKIKLLKTTNFGDIMT